MTKKPKDKRQGYKYARIKTDISLLILEGKLRPHDPIPSLNEIVQKYKVSKITARRVLNDLVLDGLVYASRGRGSFVCENPFRTDKKNTTDNSHDQLGVVFEHGSGQFMNDIISGIDEEAHERGVQINLCLSQNSYTREAENLERLSKQGVKKILLFMVVKHDEKSLNENIPLYLRLMDQGVQILLLARNLPNIQIPSLTFDDYNTYKKLIGRLSKAGRKKLAFIARNDNSSTTVERLRGFKDGILENNLPFNGDWLLRAKIGSYDTVKSDSRISFLKFLEKNEIPDGVVCSDELVSAGVFEALDELEIPAEKRPYVGGMGSRKNLHILNDHPYILLEDNTHELGRRAAALILDDELNNSSEMAHLLPVPIKFPRQLQSGGKVYTLNR